MPGGWGGQGGGGRRGVLAYSVLCSLLIAVAFVSGLCPVRCCSIARCRAVLLLEGEQDVAGMSGEKHPVMCGTMHILRGRPKRNGTQHAVNAVCSVRVTNKEATGIGYNITDGIDWPLVGGHNLLPCLLRAIRSLTPFCEASFCLGCNTPQARRVNG